MRTEGFKWKQRSLVVRMPSLLLMAVFSLCVSALADEEGSGMMDLSNLGSPENLTATEVTSVSMMLKWNMTASYNLIKGYRVFFKRDGLEDVKTFDGQTPEYNLTDLNPYTRYDVRVRPLWNEYGEGNESNTIQVVTDTDVPTAPILINATCHENLKIYLEWKKPKRSYKGVDYYYIYYKAAEDSDYQFHQVQGGDDDDQRFYLEKNNSALKASTSYSIKICAGTKSIKKTSTIYKGPFSKEEVVSLTDNGCGISTGGSTIGSIGSDLSIGILVGALGALLFILLSLVMFIIWKRHCESTYCYLEDPPSRVGLPPQGGIPDWEAEPGPDGQHGAVHVDDFPGHVTSLHADSDIGFSREYNEILRYSVDCVSATHEHSSHPENKHKNRYLNIVAYDHTRVQLTIIPGQKKSTDYINANYIDGFQKPKAYIGSQGPLDDTFESFWRMIWEQKVYVIVMITNLVERGRRKCDMYWPKEGTASYGHIDVSLVHEHCMANYTIRQLRVKHRKLKKKKWICSERTVHQFHYTGWPDHGTPADTLPVLSFIRKSVETNPEDGGPIVVHCSAGVGRTGTYIVIDAMLKQAKVKEEMNIFGFLKHIRSQRNHLVQTEEQYIFLHDALVEALASGVTEVALSEMGDYTAKLLNPVGTLSSHTLLEKQYALVTLFQPSEYDVMSARKEYNLGKNRSCDLVPIEVAKVGLTPRPGIEGSDYINASWIQGDEKVREFIITQHPTRETKDAFWTMLWDHNAQTVVLLTAVDTTTTTTSTNSPLDSNSSHNNTHIINIEEADSDSSVLPVFWPLDGEEYEQECFKVRFIERQIHEGHTTLDFLIASRYDDYELKVRIIHCPGWPHTSGPLHSVLDVVTLVQQWHLEYQNGPLVAVDEFGGTEAATFCALTTLKKQIDREASADVYQICKLYHNKRPGVWRSKEDYLFVYRVLESLAARQDGGITTSVHVSEDPDHVVHIDEGHEQDHVPDVVRIERRHSSTEWSAFESGDIKVTASRRHSLPGQANGHAVNGRMCPVDLIGSNGLADARGDSPQSNELSNHGTGSTAILVADDLVQVTLSPKSSSAATQPV